jgi:hypothetical protein
LTVCCLAVYVIVQVMNWCHAMQVPQWHSGLQCELLYRL